MIKKNQNKERRIFIDTNVLIGFYHGIKKDVEAMNYLLKLKNYECYTSALAIAQTISTCQGSKKRKIAKDAIIQFIKQLMGKINVIGFTDKDILNAMNLPTNDIEDNIQYVIGSKLSCYYYITNNIKDYKFNNISPILPKNVRTINVR
ncbi:MAG: type II toxin-antitoxin system VapC family toxin [Paludibacteraceae bacterium]|nr:type II toxin-antitoxin system VapC family toxin [Paludibacteraceae bacterium]